jgi:hypothetical protein
MFRLRLAFIKELPVAHWQVQETDWLKIIVGVSLQAIFYGLDLHDFIRKYIKLYDSKTRIKCCKLEYPTAKKSEKLSVCKN